MTPSSVKPDISPLQSSLSVVGQRLARVDGPIKVTGRAQYVADLVLPNLLIGRILRSPYAHARIVRIDTSKAKRVRGVKAVITSEDTPRQKWGASVIDIYPLAVGKVRHVGEEVAAVAAIDEATAEEALGLIEVEYEEIPAIFDPEVAMEPGAIPVHDDRDSNVVRHMHIVRGDVERGLAEADLVLEDVFMANTQFHGYLEPNGSLAEFSPSGRLTCWMPCQTPFEAQDRIATALGLPVGNVRVIQTWIGGGFGGKNADDNNVMVCGLLAMKAGRPVKIINTREEEFVASRPRVAMKSYLTMGFKKDGTVVAKRLRTIADNGAYSGKSPSIMSTASKMHDHIYRCPNILTDSYLVYTNNLPTGAVRGFGQPQTHFAVDQMLDMAAHQLGIDPLELVKRNLISPGDTTVHGQRIGSCEVRACIDQAAELIGWSEKRAARRSGRGLALSATGQVSGSRHHGGVECSTAAIRLSEDGSLRIISGESEIGQGSQTAFCQIAAEVMGVSLDDVTICDVDTDLTPWSRGAIASRLTYEAGNAIRLAAEKLKAEVLLYAAERLEARADDLVIRDRRISVAGTDRGVGLAELARRRLRTDQAGEWVVSATFNPPSESPDPKTYYGNNSGAYNYTAQAVEVEVDRQTGQVRILNFVAATDAGTVINPTLAEGQVEGGVIQGVGYALMEEVHFADGKPLNPNLSHYKLPTIADVPPFAQVFVDSWEPTGPLGAKGVGEIPIDLCPAMIANAVCDAVGVRIKETPITAEKVYRALRLAEAGDTETGGPGEEATQREQRP